MADQKYNHAEAFCLMEYVSDDGRTSETLWNSRDGVTPFVILGRNGVELTHRNWRADLCAPNYKPRPGERMFVDETNQARLERTRKLVDTYWDGAEGVEESLAFKHRWETKEEAVMALADESREEHGEGSPMVVEAGRYPEAPSTPS